MTRPQPPAPVLTVDLRFPADRDFLDALAGGSVDGLGVSSRVLVIDRTTSLTDDQAMLATLAALPQVAAVILVMVGEAQDDGTGPRLTSPAVLRGVGVALWVGDEGGVLWRGGAPAPGRGTMMLSDLVEALGLPPVFDRVFDAVHDMPNQTASPGIEVSYAVVEPAVLRLLKIRALQAMTAVGVSARQHDRESGALVAATTVADVAQTGGTPGPVSALSAVRANAGARLTAANRALAALRSWRGLFGAGMDGGVVLTRLAEAASAVREHRRVTDRLIADVESSLAEGYPTVRELVERGLPAPASVDSPQLAESLHGAFAAELAGGRTLPGLAEQARRLANRFDGARDGRAHGDPTDDAADALIRRWEQPPAFVLWPMPVLGLLPVAFATTLAAAWLPRFGLVAGLVLLGCWLAVVTQLVHRQPAGVSPRPLATGWIPIATVGVAALAGLFVARLLPPAPALGVGAVVAVAVVLSLLAMGSTVVAWHRAVQAWRDPLPIAGVANLNRRTAERLDTVISQRWRPAERNRRVADSLLVIATGLDAVDRVFRDLIDLHRATADAGREVPSVDTASELAEVLHQDLVAITLNVLQPCFEQIASRSPLTGGDRWLVNRARDGISEYNHHLDNVGFRELPPGITDDLPRRRLAATLWQNSAASRRILHTGPRGEITQLCRAVDLRLLDTEGMTHLHFASADLGGLPESLAGTEVITTNGDAVGVIRLVPVRRRIVRRTVPISDLAQTLGERWESDEPADG